MVDESTNTYGDYLIDFLIDVKCCTLNGRGDTNFDNYTSICPNRGRAVVDYMLSPYTQLQNVSEFKVMTVTDCIEAYHIPRSAQVKLPDHSLLSCRVQLSAYYQQQPATSGNARGQRDRRGASPESHVHRRYRTDILPDGMFQSDRCTRCLASIITNLQTNRMQQRDIDTSYQQIIDTLHREMDSELIYKDFTPGMKSRRKHNKPYWSHALKTLWTHARDAEKAYLTYHGNKKHRDNLRRIFCNARNAFDRELRQAERRYNAMQRDNIQQLRSSDPKAFWDAIQRLGPNTHSRALNIQTQCSWRMAHKVQIQM